MAIFWQYELPGTATFPMTVRVRKGGMPAGEVLFEVELPTKDDALTLGGTLRDMGQALLRDGGLG